MMAAATTRIEPPEGSGWQVHSPYGAQRFKDGPEGYVVRLADVVRWLLLAPREMSFANAVRAVCEPLEGNAPPLVYHLDPIEDAEPQDQPSEWVKLLHGDEGLHLMDPRMAYARLAARSMRADWLIKPRELAQLVNAPGSVEYDETRESPFEFSERTDRTGGPNVLAVPFAVAHALWGWGSVGTASTAAPAPVAAVADPLGALDADLRAAFEAVCKRRATSKDVKNGAREPWSDDDVATARKVRDAIGRTGAKTIAPLLGMTADGVRDLLGRKSKDAKAAAPTANDPFSQAKKRKAV